MNADLPTFNLMGAKMSRTNLHKDEPVLDALTSQMLNINVQLMEVRFTN